MGVRLLIFAAVLAACVAQAASARKNVLFFAVDGESLLPRHRCMHEATYHPSPPLVREVWQL